MTSKSNGPKILVLICLFTLRVIAADDFFFQRRLFCIQDTAEQCVSWNQTVTLLRSYSFGIQTYHAHTLVHTEDNGPTVMQNLKIGDQVLAHDYATGKDHYMPMKGWFLRDKHAVVALNRINTNQGFEYLMNAHQNIAVFGQNGIQFTAASRLHNGQVLHHLSNNHDQQLTIKHIMHQQNRNGLYAPYIEGMNFYIYPEPVHQRELNQTRNMGRLHNDKIQRIRGMEAINEPMILSHCLSNMQNPRHYEKLIQFGMKAVKHIWKYRQQTDHQYYESPINYAIEMLAGNGLTKMGHQYYYSSTSDDYNRKRQELKRKVNVVIALLQMDQSILITSDE